MAAAGLAFPRVTTVEVPFSEETMLSLAMHRSYPRLLALAVLMERCHVPAPDPAVGSRVVARVLDNHKSLENLDLVLMGIRPCPRLYEHLGRISHLTLSGCSLGAPSHLSRLADALRPDLHCLDLSMALCMDGPEAADGVSALASAPWTANLRQLYLQRCSRRAVSGLFVQGDGEGLVRFLEEARLPRLEVLDISENGEDPIGLAKALVSAAPRMPQLQQLDMRGCLGESPSEPLEILAKARFAALEEVDMSFNFLYRCAALAPYIRASGVKRLALRGCGLRHHAFLCGSLGSLDSLDVSNNHFTVLDILEILLETRDGPLVNFDRNIDNPRDQQHLHDLAARIKSGPL